MRNFFIIFFISAFIFLPPFFAYNNGTASPILYAADNKPSSSSDNYSFKGSEIADFKVRPSYSVVHFDWATKSPVEIYLSKREVLLSQDGARDNSPAFPGLLYKEADLAEYASKYSGPTASRDSLVQMFLQEQYVDYVVGYERLYKRNIFNKPYESELTFLYGVSLYYMARHNDSVAVLERLALNETDFSLFAQETLFSIAKDINRLDIIENIVPKLSRFTLYSLSQWLEYLYNKDRYEDIISLLNSYPALEKSYPIYVALRASCYYFLKRYDELIKLAPKVEDISMQPMIADAHIYKGNLASAEKVADKLPNGDTKDLLYAKIFLKRKDVSNATNRVKRIIADEDKLTLLFFSVNEHFSILTPEYLAAFKFNKRANNDYSNFYTGLKCYERKLYANADYYFSLIAFNKDIINQTHYYRGMANLYVDASKAAWYLNKFINDGFGEENQIALAKEMLAQIYLRNAKYDEALVLIDDCESQRCDIMKADIFLALNQPDRAYNLVQGKTDDRARLIRASVYYNNKEYERTLEELSPVKNPNKDVAYLLMMSHFKLNHIKSAENIMRKNIADIQIFSHGIQQLILLGEGKKALAYMQALTNLPDDFLLERAKLFASYNKNKEAKKDYETLLSHNAYPYEAYMGLLDISQKDNSSKEFVEASLKPIISSDIYDNKDMLVYTFANYALNNGAVTPAIGYVNYFLENFRLSPYYPDVVAVRGKLFMETGKNKACVEEADRMLAGKIGPREDALFMKAECLEGTEKDAATTIYKELAKSSDKYKSISTNKIITLSNHAEDIYAYANPLRETDRELWVQGITRFLDLSTKEDYAKHKQDILSLSKDAPNNIRSMAYWRIGKAEFENNNYEKASYEFLKGYYLFPQERYSVENLTGAKASYKKRKMNDEVAVVDKLIAKSKVKSIKNISSLDDDSKKKPEKKESKVKKEEKAKKETKKETKKNSSKKPTYRATESKNNKNKK